MSNTWDIRPDERVFIAGQTGSGKSTLSGALVAFISRLVAIDPKGDLPAGKWRLDPWTKRNLKDLEDGDPARLHYIPDPDSETDWDALYRYLFYTEDLTLYIDELNMALPRRWRSEHTGLHMIYQQGRSRNIRTIGVTQFPSYIPLIAYDQSQWFFCFRILNGDHRARMAEIMGKEIDKGKPAEIWPDKHGFWVYHISWTAPRYYPSFEAPRRQAELQED